MNLQLAYNMTLEVSELVCVLSAKHTCWTYMQHLKKYIQNVNLLEN